MNLDKIKELLELAKLLDDNGVSADQPKSKRMIGEYVIVRCKDAGVHAGILVDYEGRTVELKDSRRLWRWWCNESISLSAAAEFGIKHSDSKIAPMLSEINLLDACEIIKCSDVGATSIKTAPVAEQS